MGCAVRENLEKSSTSVPSTCKSGPVRKVSESFVDWSVWMPMVPSRYAVVCGSRFRGHQETWNAQLSIVEGCNNIKSDIN